MTDTLHAKSNRFSHVNGIQMHYVVHGSGPTIVLLHGFPETHRSWDLQVPALVDAGYRVITPDLRGYGSTDRPRDGYELESLGRDIAELIDAVSHQPVFLVGHDWGGAVAWHVATHFPQRLRRVIVLNCPHPVRMVEALVSDREQLARSWYMLFFQLPVLPEWWLTKDDGRNLTRLFRANFRRPHEPPREILEASRRSLLEPNAARAAVAYYRAALRTWSHPLRRRQASRSYRPIEVPVSVIWGERDIALGKKLLEGTERFAPRLDIALVPDAGHFVHQEQPDVVNARLLEAVRTGPTGNTPPSSSVAPTIEGRLRRGSAPATLTAIANAEHPCTSVPLSSSPPPLCFSSTVVRASATTRRRPHTPSRWLAPS